MDKPFHQASLFATYRPLEVDEPADPWFRSRGYRIIAGVDEVGRGALAGPVCAAAVVLGLEKIEGLNDSKLLDAETREALSIEIWAKAKAVGVAFLGPEKIDEMNILWASLDAMRLAVEMLSCAPDIVLVDGNQVPACKYQAVPLIKGDRRSESIMAASIVAKVSRDNYMLKASRQYPGYGFEIHKGYAVSAHQKALIEIGLSPIHRKSYAPCKDILRLSQMASADDSGPQSGWLPLEDHS